MVWPANLPGPYAMRVVASAATNPKKMIRSSRNTQYTRGRIDQYDVTYCFTATQFQDWVTFYKSIGKGANWFAVDLFDGKQYTAQTVRILPVPAITDDFPRKNVQYRLEVYSRVVVTVEDVDSFLTGNTTPIQPGLRIGKSRADNGNLRFGIAQR